MDEIQMMISIFDRVENNDEKEENAGYRQFILFPQCFQVFYYRIIKSQDYVANSQKDNFVAYFTMLPMYNEVRMSPLHKAETCKFTLCETKIAILSCHRKITSLNHHGKDVFEIIAMK